VWILLGNCYKGGNLPLVLLASSLRFQVWANWKVLDSTRLICLISCWLVWLERSRTLSNFTENIVVLPPPVSFCFSLRHVPRPLVSKEKVHINLNTKLHSFSCSLVQLRHHPIGTPQHNTPYKYKHAHNGKNNKESP